MASKIRGIEIEIGGNTTKLTTALKNADSEVRSLNKDVNSLKGDLKIEWDDSKFQKAQKDAAQALEVTREKVETVKKAMQNLGEPDGDNAEAIKELEKELQKAESRAIRAKKQLQEVNNLKYDKAVAEIKKVEDGLNAVAKGFAVFTGAVTAAAAATVAFAKASADDADRIDKMSQSLGISRQAFQEWDYILQINGASIDGLSMGMKTLVTNIDGARSGTASAVQKFNDLADASGKLVDTSRSQEEVFTDVVAALQQVEDETRKAALANSLLGEAGIKLMPLLNSETASIEQLREEAHKLGIVLGDDVVNAGVDLVDNITRLQSTVNAFKNNFASGFIPILNDAAEAMLDGAAAGGDAARTAREMGEAFGEVVEMFTTLAKTAYDAKEIILATAAAAATLKAGLTLAETIIGITKAVQAYKLATDAAAVSQGTLNTVIAANPYIAIGVAIAAVTTGIIAFAAASQGASATAQELNAKLDEINENFERMAQTDYGAAAAQSIEAIDEQIDTTKSKIEEMRESLDNAVSLGLDGSFYNAIQKEIESSQEVLDTLEKTKEEYVKKLDDWRDRENRVNNEQRIEGYSNAINQLKRLRNDDIISEEQYLRRLDALKGAYGSEPQDVDYFAAAVEELDYLRSLDLISAESYYSQLADLRDKYLQEDSKEWRSATQSIYSYNKSAAESQASAAASYASAAKSAADQQLREEEAETKRQLSELQQATKEAYDAKKATAKEAYDEMKASAKAFYDQRLNDIKNEYAAEKEAFKASYDEQVKIAKDSYAAQKAAAKDAYDAELAAIEANYKAKNESINATIKAIDDEIAARNQLKQETDYDRQIAEIQGRLDFGKLDEFSYREMEAQLKRVKDEQAEYQWRLEQDARKESLKEELADAKELADQNKADLKANYDMQVAAMEEAYNRNLEYLKESYESGAKAMEEAYNLNTEQLKATYELQTKEMDAAYKKQVEQLDAIYTEATKQFTDIANNFVDQIDRGISITVQRLKDAISAANSAARNAQSAVSSSSTVNNNAVTFSGTSYTDAQARALINQVIYPS